jgi:hypothetical protein
VTPQVCFVIELFWARFTLVWLLTCMFAQVLLVQEFCSESFATPITLEWLVT